MQAGDDVLTEKGEWERVNGDRPLKGVATVYNFEVQDDHDYFVGTTGFLVHNSICDYSQRVLDRMAETANDPFHNFPGSFDQEVVENGVITEITPNYVQYELYGEINGTPGFYQVGGDWVDDVFVITHSFFEPL